MATQDRSSSGCPCKFVPASVSFSTLVLKFATKSGSGGLFDTCCATRHFEWVQTKPAMSGCPGRKRGMTVWNSFLSCVARSQVPVISRTRYIERNVLCRVYSILLNLRVLARHIRLQQGSSAISVELRHALRGLHLKASNSFSRRSCFSCSYPIWH